MGGTLDEAIQAKSTPDLTTVSKIDEIPYDFVRKRLSVVVDETFTGATTRRLIAKGALEPILTICTQVWEGGQAMALDQARRRALADQFAGWSADGFRVLGIAERVRFVVTGWVPDHRKPERPGVDVTGGFEVPAPGDLPEDL